MNGAQALIESLLQEQVDHIFGYAGATICPAADALKEHPEIAYTLVRTEQNAGHMASGYARISGKVGVCMVTSGPGATNLITGIATAYMDSIPMASHHRPGTQQSAGAGYLPGGGYHWRGGPLLQAHATWSRTPTTSPHRQGGLSHRLHWPARPGAHRLSEERHLPHHYDRL